ncbi:isochorismatase family protein [Acidisphaera sp. L21]|uniref:isochorismatase family protein n=1 Tax=Acidisphaera sp. L21 TaxID=1641851 RepID=UPI00131E8994|nr:isochorismatase family protein [Acidisphaera sp. L21]
MEHSNKSARTLFEELKQRPTRARFGFGQKVAIVNVDPQKAYTLPDEYVTAYETDPKQMQYINELSALCRDLGSPVIWTHVAYLPSGEDCGIWGTRSNTPDSLQNVKIGSRRAEFDDRLVIDHDRDVVINKRMASAFHETNLPSLLMWHRVDTLIVTGGSTSGCVRATVVDSLSHGFRTIVPEECTTDRHESPHFANLYDMSMKYADVMPVEQVRAALLGMKQRPA